MPHGHVDEARRRVRAMQEDLASATSRTRLLTREPSTAEAETWMEIYEEVAPAFERLLAAAVGRHALAECIGERHVERFVEPAR